MLQDPRTSNMRSNSAASIKSMLSFTSSKNKACKIIFTILGKKIKMNLKQKHYLTWQLVRCIGTTSECLRLEVK
jgi:hypothetical protein